MFGLMHPQKTCNNKSTPTYRHHRMHYCGTCKTLGVQYGQRARALLNFDVVFFAELLSHLSEEKLAEWQVGYQAINQCFTMPEVSDSIPASLNFAATANVLLAELKLDDNQKDTGNWRWTVSQKLFSKSFQKAKLALEKLGVETEKFTYWIQQQEVLEKEKKADFWTVQETLNHYAEPTAQMTAYLFAQGAIAVGQAENAEKMFKLGYHFGQLIYGLDALEDVEKDARNGEFNPLLLFFNQQKTLSDFQWKQAQEMIAQQQIEVLNCLQNLPFAEDVIEQFSARLVSNLTLRIYQDRPQPTSIKEDLVAAQKTVFQSIGHFFQTLNHQFKTANYYFISLLIFILPLVADYGVRGDNSNANIYEHLAIITVALGTIAIAKKGAKRKNRRRMRRFLHKMNKKRERFVARLQRIVTRKDGCWEECCGACLAGCLAICCEEICASMCQAIEERKIWPWAVLFFIGVAIAAVIIFV